MSYTGLFYPTHLALLCVGDNFMPIAWWMPVSKEPFRFALAIDKSNFTLHLLRTLGEAALCFPVWAEREWVVESGYLTGRKGSKAERLSIPMRPARQLVSTQVPQSAQAVFELRVTELPLEGDHVVFVGDVVHVEGNPIVKQEPILFLGFHHFATLGEWWTFEPKRRPSKKKRG